VSADEAAGKMRSQKERFMAESKALKAADSLVALPTAKEVMEQIALKKQRKLPLPRASFQLQTRRKRH